MLGLFPLTESAFPVERIGQTYPHGFPQQGQDWLPIYILDALEVPTHIWGWQLLDKFSLFLTCPQRKALIHK
jgi:hypothetical protein